MVQVDRGDLHIDPIRSRAATDLLVQRPVTLPARPLRPAATDGRTPDNKTKPIARSGSRLPLLVICILGRRAPFDGRDESPPAFYPRDAPEKGHWTYSNEKEFIPIGDWLEQQQEPRHPNNPERR
jgi:hypothetical protein